MTSVYTVKITYQHCDNRIWRIVQLSSNATLADVGYTILATFNTTASHLFQITYQKRSYSIDPEEPLCCYDVKISSLKIPVGAHLNMVYDFGCWHEFDIEVLDIQPMGRGQGRAYPKIIDGAGRGILEDVFPDQLLQFIRQIDMDGVSNVTYFDEYGREVSWDYRHYVLKADQYLHKGMVEWIRNIYEEEFL